MSFDYGSICNFELDEMPTPEVNSWVPVEVGLENIELFYMSARVEELWNNGPPLTPEAEEMLIALTVGRQIEMLTTQIEDLTRQRTELLQESE